MYKLTVVAGPNTGTSFPLKEGETSVGRQTGNVIVLPSAKVSKKHCVFQVAGGEITMADQGSSNGTFVNGSLAKSKKLKVGDRVSIGDFVLEVSKPAMRAAGDAPVAALGGAMRGGMPGLVQQRAGMPAGGMQGLPGMGMPGAISPGAAAPAPPSGSGADMPVPTDIKGKIVWGFERTVMPFFYGMNLSYDLKAIGAILFGLFVVLAMVISVYPLVMANRDTIVRETTMRAQFMARQIVERNMAALAEGANSKTDIGSIPREDGVIVAVLTDLDSRVLAPAASAGSHLASGEVGVTARKVARLFQRGREVGYAGAIDQDMVVAVEPVKVLDPRIGRNVVVGMGVVALDTSLATPDIGTIGVTYSHSFIITALIGMFLLVVLYRLSLKRFEVLNEDLDKVLKGEIRAVTNEFKAEDFDQLWDVINSALQRLPKGGGGEEVAGVGGVPSDEYIGPMRMIGDLGTFGVLVCDEERKIIYSNTLFEDMSGIRASDAAGQEIATAARDQAFVALTTDMFNQVQSGGSATEDYEFSGVPVKVNVSSFGSGGAKGYAIIVVKKVEGE